jgi:hypothetical protein
MSVGFEKWQALDGRGQAPPTSPRGKQHAI